MVHFMEKSIKTDENWGGYPHDLGNSHVNIMGIIDKWSVFIGKSFSGDWIVMRLTGNFYKMIKKT